MAQVVVEGVIIGKGGAAVFKAEKKLFIRR